METLKNLSCGCLGGVLAKVVESPFDTVKVRLQHSPTLYATNMDCTVKIFRSEGIRGFFRGLPAPMSAGGMENAVSFAFFAFGLELQQRLMPWGGGEDATSTPLSRIVLAGAFSGFACSFTLTPMELVKCTLQVQDMEPKEKRVHRGVVDCFIRLFRKEGFLGMYRGHTATMARETPGNAAFFASYHTAKRLIAGPNETSETLPFWKLLIAGGFGGVGYWTAFFPADVVKTKMQVDVEYRQLGLWKGLLHTYKCHGFRGLYAGWCITVVRAFPANAIVFTTFEYASSFWDDCFGTGEIDLPLVESGDAPNHIHHHHSGSEHFAPSHPA